MILKGSQRAGGRQLAAHLMNDRDNDHVTVLEMRGFVADDLNGAFAEAHAISKGTKCQQYLFSLSLNPPIDASVGEEDFLKAVDQAEKQLGLDGQPRAIVLHEKEGRRHAHVVWSRIDSEAMRAVNLPHYKTRLTELSRELYFQHDWRLPDGLAHAQGKNPLNFTLEEWQRAKRLKIDPREIKSIFRDAWGRSDNATALGNALAERGFHLARGDRRSIVAVSVEGEVFSLSRWAGVKAKDVRHRFGDDVELPNVSTRQADLAKRMAGRIRDYIRDVDDRHDRTHAPLREAKEAMVRQHRQERAKLRAGQEQRWHTETQQRSDRIRNGLAGLWDRLTGERGSARRRNEREAYLALQRDRAQRDDLVKSQMRERRDLQNRIEAQRRQHARDRRILDREVAAYLRNAERARDPDRFQSHEHEQAHTRRPDLSPSLDP